MIKPTKRHAFNFLRSYFDVLNEIPKKEDKLSFLLSIINKQFLDEDPEDLNFIVKLSYESQRHQIESSVKGYKDKKKTDLLGKPLIDGVSDPTQGGGKGGGKAPTVQEKEKEKEKVQDVGKKQTFNEKKKGFIIWFNQCKKFYTGKEGKSKVLTKPDENNLKKLIDSYEQADFDIAIKNLYNSKWAEENNMRTISHFVRIENFNKYLEQGDSVSQHKTINNQPAN